MGSEFPTRRSLLQASAAAAAAIGLSGCSDLLQPRSPVTIGRTSAHPVVRDASETVGPLLYGTVVNSADEHRNRIDWRAFNELVITDHPERPPEHLRDVPYDRACVTVFTTRFDLHPLAEQYDQGMVVVPVEFHGETCTFDLTVADAPPLMRVDGDTGERRYYTQMRLWDMEAKQIPTDGTVRFTVDTSQTGASG